MTYTDVDKFKTIFQKFVINSFPFFLKPYIKYFWEKLSWALQVDLGLAGVDWPNVIKEGAVISLSEAVGEERFDGLSDISKAWSCHGLYCSLGLGDET